MALTITDLIRDFGKRIEQRVLEEGEALSDSEFETELEEAIKEIQQRFF